MTAGQKKLLGICKKHIENNELKEAIETITALLQGDQQSAVDKLQERAWMKGANPLSFLDNKKSEPCIVCKTETPLKDLAAIHRETEHAGVCRTCIDKIPEGFTLCGCGG
jgi:hypothetical protein